MTLNTTLKNDYLNDKTIKEYANKILPNFTFRCNKPA